MTSTTAFICILIATFLILSVFQFYIQSYVQPGTEILGGVLGSSQKCVTGTATSTSGIKYGNYRIYSDLGSNGAWARIIIKDSKGKTVDTHTVNQGNSYYSTAAGLTIRIVSVRALTDGTIVGVNLYAGTSCPTPTTTTTTRSTTSTTTTTPQPSCVSGTATATASMSYGSYKIYSDLAASNTWTRILIKNSAGNTVDSKIINRGDSWDFPTVAFTVRVDDVRALQDGTVIGVDLVAGPTGTYCPPAKATITTDKTSYQYDDTITFYLSGFTPSSSANVSLLYPGIALGGGFSIDTYGKSVGNILLGRNLPPYGGPATLTARDSSHSTVANLTLNLASISTNKTSYMCGDTVYFSFIGFNPNTRLNISLQYPGISLGGGFDSDSQGSGSGNMYLGTNLPAYAGSAVLKAYGTNNLTASTNLTLNLNCIKTTITTTTP